MLDGIQPNDEGLMLQAAARIADGQVPYSDFWWFYPPGQPYLLAGLWELFGPSLLPWRVLRVLCDAGVALLVWMLALRGGASPRVALAAWLVAALAMAYPTGPHPFPPTLADGARRAAAPGAPPGARRRAGRAGRRVADRVRGLPVAGSGAGVCGAAGGPRASTPARRGCGRRSRSPARPQRSPRSCTCPVVAAAGLGDSFDLLVRYPVEDFSDYQSLPFPLDYDGPLNTDSIGGFLSDSAENLLVFYLPLVLVLGLVGALAALALRFDRERWWQVAAAVFAIGMAHYLLTRPDVFHTAPLAVMVAVLGAWTLAEPRPRQGAWRDCCRIPTVARQTPPTSSRFRGPAARARPSPPSPPPLS